MRMRKKSLEIWWFDWEVDWRRLARWMLPSPGNVLFTLLVVGGLLWATSAGALPFRAPTLAGDSTTTVSYQGRLADSGGDPVTTSGVGMQFRLYNTDSGGSSLWEEPHTAVPVEDGLFHVLLGSTDPIPVSLLANNSTLWLGITVGSDSEMTPREQIASVPYAMIASTVADGSVTTAKIADGSITEAKLASGLSLIPSGTIVMWSGSLSAIPEGWSLCDGTNGTPNLLDRFVVGVPDAVTDPGGTGGSHTKTLTIANMPPHTHSLYKTGAAPAQTTGVDIVSGSCDDYSGYIGYSGSGTAFDIRPQYYEIAFIMKLP